MTKTMVITGDLRSDDDIFVDGQLLGSIKTSRTLHATDFIVGDINAQNAFFSNARIKENVTLTDDLIAGDNSAIIGDVKCKNARISGKIKGNCDIEGSAQLATSALLSGDLTASDIAAEQGARIIGTVSTGAKDINIDAEFDFGDEL